LLLTCPLSEEYLLSMTEQNPPETSYLNSEKGFPMYGQNPTHRGQLIIMPQ
jgi:hypothetical protein